VSSSRNESTTTPTPKEAMKEKARAGSEDRDDFRAAALVVVVSGRSLMAVTEREGVRVVV
jgi:hypothetical protein